MMNAQTAKGGYAGYGPPAFEMVNWWKSPGNNKSLNLSAATIGRVSPCNK